MRRAMFIGPIGCGKTTLIQKLNNAEIHYNKTQTVEFYDNAIDTPGEYIEHRSMYSNLITTAMSADIILILQSAIDSRIILPTGFRSIFNDKETIGIVTKTDIADENQIQLVEKRLLDTGVSKIFKVSSYTDSNIDDIIEYLN